MKTSQVKVKERTTIAEEQQDDDDDYELFHGTEKPKKEVSTAMVVDTATEKLDFIKSIKELNFNIKDVLKNNSMDIAEEEERSNNIEEQDSDGEMSDGCLDKIKNIVGEHIDFRGSRKRKREKSTIPPEIKRMLGEANLHFSLGQYTEAIQVLHDVIKLKPNLAEPYQTLGLIYEEKHEISKAIDLYIISALLTSSKDTEIWKNLSKMSLNIQNIHQAIYCLSRVIKKCPSDVNALWDKSMLLIQINEWKKACGTLTSILKIREGHPQVTLELARLHFVTLNNIPQAINVLETSILAALRKNRLDMNVTNMLLELYIASSDYKKGITLVEFLAQGESIPQIFPLEITVSYGTCQAHCDNIDKTTEMFNYLLEHSPSRYGDLYYRAAETYLEIQKYKNAMTFYSALLRDINYNQPPIWIKLGRCEKHLHNYHSAINHYLSVYNIMPDEYESCMSLVEIYKNNNMIEKAIEILDGNITYLLKQNITPDPRILAEKAQIHLQLHQDAEFINCMNWMLKEEYLIANRDVTPFARKRKQHKDFDIYDVDTDNAESPTGLDRSTPSVTTNNRSMSSNRSPSSSRSHRNATNRTPPSSSKKSSPSSRKQRQQSNLSFDCSTEESENDEDEDDDDLQIDDDYDEDDDDTFPPPPVEGSSSAVGREEGVKNNDDDGEGENERVLDFKVKKKKKRIKDETPTHPGVLELLSEEKFHSLVVTAIKKLYFEQNFEIMTQYLENILKYIKFSNPDLTHELRNLLIAIGLTSGNFEVSFKQVRTMCKEFPYCIRVWQLLSLVISKDTEGDREKRILQVLLRMSEKYPESLPIKILIGHTYSLGGNFALALSFYYEVYNAAPNDPFINFYIALVYLGQVMNRKLANRHYCVIQSFAHLYLYYSHRSSKHEANYNMGRAFQQLGLNHIAIYYYELALSEYKQNAALREKAGDSRDHHPLRTNLSLNLLDDRRFERDADLTREIAYNLSLIYRASGSNELARQLLREYLTF